MNSFTIYKEYYELITLLSEREQADLSLGIIKYMFEDITPKLNERQQKIFNNLKRPLDISKENSLRSKGHNNKPNNKPETKPNNKPKRNQTTNRMSNQKETHQDVNVNVIVNVINYLNNKLNSNFKYTTKTTQQKINARLNEGYNLDDFIVVIDKKYDEWINTEFEKYLCPETLFGTKFEKYLNQKNIKNKKSEPVPDWINKNYETEEATVEEIEEMDEMLKQFE